MLKTSKAFSSFSVDDLEKAKAFYGQILGLKVTQSYPGVFELHVEGGSAITVYPKPDHEPATFTILNFIVGNILETVNQLSDLGVTFEQYDGDLKTDEKGISRMEEGPSMAWFKDPAGNILSVFEET